MIKSAVIKNYILIDEITLELDKGFNVVTGETGAGKSIIISAIDAALGAKAGGDTVKTNCGRAYIELLIELKPDFDKSIFEKGGIDVFNNEITISREILPSYTRSRINGILVTQDFIKEIREKLLDIHTQHQNYNYMQPKNHITLLDNFAQKAHKDNLNLFNENYRRYTELAKKLEEYTAFAASKEQKKEFIIFQIKEIEAANVQNTDEDEELKKELEILSNLEKIKELSYSSYQALNGGETSALNILSKVKSNLAKLAAADDKIAPLEDDFINAYETLKETASYLRNYFETKENDEERINFISERLSCLDKLKRKHGGSLQEVLNTYESLSAELNSIDLTQDEIIKTESEIKELKTELDNLAVQISNTRKELGKMLSNAVTEKLQNLELPKARFEISIENCPMNEKGTDKIEFLISANVSESLKPLAKTASGGEISRIMLAIKSVFARADDTDTVIFDEIDTGISGKASQAVAEEIQNLSKSHQIILITHQPVTAAKAAAHFYVKKTQTDTTKINVYNLSGENRVKAIAILAAGEINKESLSFAQNLLGYSSTF